jgi:methylmalonyl-CoA/ethylmalonyl-CoA epimerase
MPVRIAPTSLRLHHTGIVVSSTEASWDDWVARLGVVWRSQIFHDPIQRVRVVFLGSGRPGEAQVQLIRQDTVGSTLIRSAQPAVAFEGRRIAWFYTKTRIVTEILEATAPR